MKRAELMQLIEAEVDGVLSECKGANRVSENPLEVWTMFIDRLDCRVRCRIGDELDRTGKNRYTGK